MNFEERTLKIGNAKDGQEIAIKIYNGAADNTLAAGGQTRTVLALHGWLDNVATFDLLAPLLGTVRVVAIDLPGHGRSSHRAQGAEYYIWSYVEDVMMVADALELEQFTLLGHSMGGAIAGLVSSLYPERVQQLALLDALGPLPTSVAEAPAQMRKALDQKQGLRERRVRYYETQQAAVAVRANKGLSMGAAKLLGDRGISQDDNGYYWASDQRLTRANLMSMTEAHVENFLQQIRCPTLLIAAAELLDEKHEFFKHRLTYIKDIEIIKLEGSHHQHMEAETEQVAGLLNAFFG